MYLLSLSATCKSSNSVEELTQFLWNEFNKEKEAPLPVVKWDEEDKFLKVPSFKKSHTVKSIKLTLAQYKELEVWQNAVENNSRNLVEFNLSTNTFCTSKVQSIEFIKLVDQKGQKLVFHHWYKGEKSSKRMRNAWRWADAIICCHSATIPSEYRHKVAVYSGGVVSSNETIVLTRKG